MLKFKQSLINYRPARQQPERRRQPVIPSKRYIRAQQAVSVLFLLLVFFSCTADREESGEPRYIITSPEVGEIVYLLQGAKDVVGVTSEVNYPPAFSELPQVGRFGAVSLERIIELNPTLVLTSGLEQQELVSDLSKVGINALMIYPLSVEQMLDGIEKIAAELSIPERGKEARDSLETAISGLTEEIHSNPKVYIEIYGNPIMSVSDESFIGELIALAGGDNIFPTLPREYSRIRQEDVIAANPEIIIVTYPGVTAGDIKNRKGWSRITACVNERIYTLEDINPDHILRAGPRMLKGIESLKEIFSR